ncbi:MAG: alpha-glucosidase [Candidatus Lernaella stagnicola]|nr:alpha-glucosidase [Candidatus Lernaella stagnicola]
MRKYVFLLALLLVTVALASCAGDDDDDDNSSAFVHPPGWHWLAGDDGALEIWYGERLMQAVTGVDALTFDVQVPMLFGQFRFQTKNEKASHFQISLRDGRPYITAGGEIVGAIIFEHAAGDNLRMRVAVEQAGYDGLKLRFRLEDGARFWGFGEQYNFIEMRGKRVPIWVAEQGLGRLAYPALPPFGSKLETYFPMPYFLDPEAGKGLLLENSEFSRFDLGSATPQEWTLEVWNGRGASILLFPGPTGYDVIGQLTQEVGRPKTLPPDWAFEGVWIAAQGGTELVAQRVRNALDAGVPVTAVWAQDWLGIRNFGLGNYGVKYRWIHDEELYPFLPGFIDALAEEGVRFLGYFNPFVAPAYEHYNEMRERGYLIETPRGDPYLFPISTFVGTLVDLTDPGAVAYFKHYARRAVDLGMKGWMCDFGEWLPYNAALHEGDAAWYHNRYPSQWHRINREVLEQAYPDGDFAIFTRSGYTGDHQTAQIVWAGDQEATWDEADGFPTVIAAGLTLGLAGIPFFSHDIGGFSGGPREKELFWRWTELGAFTPVMRNHDGLQKLENHQFDSAADTLAMFARFGKIHAAMFPYFRELAEEAQATGLPIVRHTALVDPDWEPAYSAHRQWMIGEDMVFAPVVEKGVKEVTVYFPDGQWENVFTGETFSGRQVTRAAALVGQPAVFARVGALDDIVAAIRALPKN